MQNLSCLMPRERLGSSSLVSFIVVRVVVKTVGKYKATIKNTQLSSRGTLQLKCNCIHVMLYTHGRAYIEIGPGRELCSV